MRCATGCQHPRDRPRPQVEQEGVGEALLGVRRFPGAPRPEQEGLRVGGALSRRMGGSGGMKGGITQAWTELSA